MNLPVRTPSLAGEDLLSRAADKLLALPYRSWRFGDSIAFEAMVDASRALGRDRWREFARGFIRSWAASATEHFRLDCTAPGLAMIKIFEDTGDQLVLDGARRLADYLMTRPTMSGAFQTFDRASLQPPFSGEELSPADRALLDNPPAGVYVDCLHFDPPFFAALGRVTGDSVYADVAASQALAYIRLLQDQESGLFHHFALAGQPHAYISSWGRGQGWALLGLTDLVALLPSDHPDRVELCAAATRLIDGVLHYQSANGSWHTLIDDPTSGAESTTSAFLAAGFHRAAELGLVSRPTVRSAIGNAWAAVLSHERDGLLRDASDAVRSSTVRSHYTHVEVDVISPWSQGALVLMLAGDDSATRGSSGGPR
ncbi:MAG: glycoside hydrolase family 88 protein [Jatrophihabitans sp.]